MTLSRIKKAASSRTGLLALGAAIAAATALWVEAKARRAERAHLPEGDFIDIDGVHLHYVDLGVGPPVVLFHGNTVTLADFAASGLIDRLAQTHRVIAFDRPGFGHSDRPRDRLWTPAAQAALFAAALKRLGIDSATVVGHSMGTLTALALALDHPAQVRSLVLLGGYFYPTLRIDALMTAPVALPVLGDAMRYTVTALSARALIGGLAKGMFKPRNVPGDFFDAVPRELMLRPVQLRANAEDAAFMMPAARAISKRYAELTMPVAIIAGAADKVVDHEAHSVRLHGDLLQSELVVVPDAGHMVHYVAQDQILAAIDKARQRTLLFADDSSIITQSDLTLQPRSEKAMSE